jgi:hypothetical protein
LVTTGARLAGEDGVESSTCDVMILEVSPYRRLVARNNQPLSEKEARKVAADFEKTRRKRRLESEEDRRRRLEREERQLQESRRFLAEIPAAFETSSRSIRRSPSALTGSSRPAAA